MQCSYMQPILYVQINNNELSLHKEIHYISAINSLVGSSPFILKAFSNQIARTSYFTRYHIPIIQVMQYQKYNIRCNNLIRVTQV